MSHFPRGLVLATALASSLAAAGCTSGLLRSQAPPVQQYVLHAAPAAQGAIPVAAARPSLRVLQPMPAPGLDTDRIALFRGANRMDYYAASRWGASLPEVVGSLGVEILRDTGAWSTVVDSRTLFNADYQLQVSIGRFEADYTGGGGSGAAVRDAVAPVASVSLQCLLTRRADGSVVASFTAAAQQQAAENRMGSVVAAFEAAANTALAEAAARAAAAVTR